MLQLILCLFTSNIWRWTVPWSTHYRFIYPSRPSK